MSDKMPFNSNKKAPDHYIADHYITDHSAGEMSKTEPVIKK